MDTKPPVTQQLELMALFSDIRFSREFCYEIFALICISTCLNKFRGHTFPCDLNSLMHLKNIVHFTSCSALKMNIFIFNFIFIFYI